MTDYYVDNVLRERWDDTTRTYTAWDEDGVETENRPYSAEENARADAEAHEQEQESNKSTIETNLEADLEAMQAVIDQENAALRDDPSQEVKDIARAVRRLIRMALDDYSGTE